MEAISDPLSWGEKRGEEEWAGRKSLFFFFRTVEAALPSLAWLSPPFLRSPLPDRKTGDGGWDGMGGCQDGGEERGKGGGGTNEDRNIACFRRQREGEAKGVLGGSKEERRGGGTPYVGRPFPTPMGGRRKSGKRGKGGRGRHRKYLRRRMELHVCFFARVFWVAVLLRR